MRAVPASHETPLLSIVVPVYRVELYLGCCLDSILSEAGDGLEVVCVDDSSPDRCGEILADYARRDPRVRVVRLPTNVGLGQARNAGLEHATGEYVWFVDSDDWLPDGAVAAVVARLTATRPDVLVVDHAEVFDDGRVAPSRPDGVLRGVSEPIQLSQRPELLRSAQSACTKVVRREFLDETKLRFLPGWYEDSSFSHPLLMAARRIDVLDRVCYHYRQRPVGGITKTVSARHFEVFDQYERLFEMVGELFPESEALWPHLFRVMVDHYLVIVGNEYRVPPQLRREFFRRMAVDFRSRLPAEGYGVPSGVAGLKHRLVRHDAYWAYALLRRAHRAAGGLLSGRAEPRRPRVVAPAVPAPAHPPCSGRTTGR